MQDLDEIREQRKLPEVSALLSLTLVSDFQFVRHVSTSIMQKGGRPPEQSR